MQAVSHIATALILKKAVPSAPLFGLIIATEMMEYLWVALNLAGVELTVIDETMRSVADIHLAHMPFSHSLLTSVLIAAAVGLVILWRGGRAASAVALVMALGVVSHIVLDLLVHAPDIVLGPMLEDRKFGTGLYANLPMLALAIETLWCVLCWWIYRGNWKLLGLIVVLSISSVPFYSPIINTGEAALGGQSTSFAVMILVQMLATSVLVWLFARQPRTADKSG